MALTGSDVTPEVFKSSEDAEVSVGLVGCLDVVLVDFDGDAGSGSALMLHLW